jgi:hypothetical protein
MIITGPGKTWPAQRHEAHSYYHFAQFGKLIVVACGCVLCFVCDWVSVKNLTSFSF